jgi:hypothetical protein
MLLVILRPKDLTWRAITTDLATQSPDAGAHD